MQLAVGVTTHPDDPVAEPTQPREHFGRLLAARTDVAADDDRRVVRHLREDGVERGEVAVDVVQRRDGGHLVGDLELEPAARLHPAGADDRAQRPDEPALAADHLADVVLGHMELEDERPVVLLDLLDAHGVGLVDEPAGKLGDELGHSYWIP